MIMINFDASLLIFLLCCYITPTAATDMYDWDKPLCMDSEEGTPCILRMANECRAAIDMIPSGSLAIDPAYPGNRDQPNPIDLAFHPGRHRKFLLPAAFRSGDCLVQVEAVYLPRRPHPPTNAASAMYYIVWPNVRKMAKKIIWQCSLIPLDRTSGYAITKSKLGTWEFAYKVTVKGIPKQLRPADARGRRQLPPTFQWFNIYEVDENARNRAGPSRGGGNGQKAAH